MLTASGVAWSLMRRNSAAQPRGQVRGPVWSHLRVLPARPRLCDPSAGFSLRATHLRPQARPRASPPSLCPAGLSCTSVPLRPRPRPAPASALLVPPCPPRPHHRPPDSVTASTDTASLVEQTLLLSSGCVVLPAPALTLGCSPRHPSAGSGHACSR